MTHLIPSSYWYRPLAPDTADQGDPFALRIPDGVSANSKYYCYTTVDGASNGGWAFNVFSSDDLINWRKLNRALIADPDRAHWAPCVVFVPELSRPYVMLFSKGQGHGNLAHRQQQIFRADSLAPEGPFEQTGATLTPGLDFAIDPDLFPLRDGTFRLTFATDFDTPDDFADGQRAGTGLVTTIIDRAAEKLLARLTPLARATGDWQIYESKRNDQFWKPWFETAKPVRWHCIEGPASVSEDEMVYSGGNFNGYYAVGVLKKRAHGLWEDLSSEKESALIRPWPERDVHSIGHCSVILGPDEALYSVAHMRSAPEAVRQLTIVPIYRDGGRLRCPEPKSQPC